HLALVNQTGFDPEAAACDGARFFVVKAFTEDDIHRSIKSGMWCSGESSNRRLDAIWREGLQRSTGGEVAAPSSGGASKSNNKTKVATAASAAAAAAAAAPSDSTASARKKGGKGKAEGGAGVLETVSKAEVKGSEWNQTKGSVVVDAGVGAQAGAVVGGDPAVVVSRCKEGDKKVQGEGAGGAGRTTNAVGATNATGASIKDTSLSTETQGGDTRGSTNEVSKSKVGVAKTACSGKGNSVDADATAAPRGDTKGVKVKETVVEKTTDKVGGKVATSGESAGTVAAAACKEEGQGKGEVSKEGATAMEDKRPRVTVGDGAGGEAVSASAAKGNGMGKSPLFLFFSVNASGQFCGAAQMTGPLDHSKK
ncbi:unnamed protein product, partial [Choristocarpus tenellus]